MAGREGLPFPAPHPAVHPRFWKEAGEKLGSFLVEKGFIACGLGLGRGRRAQGAGGHLKGRREGIGQEPKRNLKVTLSLAPRTAFFFSFSTFFKK